MIRAFLVVLLCALASGAFAQGFTGYPPAGYLQYGNDSITAPQWRPASVVPQGRLTLQSNTPVMTTTQPSQHQIYLDCYNGSVVPVFNGTVDVPLAIAACQVTDTLNTSGTGVTNANGVFDEWAVNANGVLAICHATNGSGGGWLSDTGGSNTARGTGYTQLDYVTRPYVTNKNALANCYAGSIIFTVAANQATHLGTFGTDGAAGSVTWQYGVSGTTPTSAIFNLWNRYNRALNAVTTFADSTTPAWTYATAAWREAHGDTTFAVVYTVGDAFDGVAVNYSAPITSSATTTQCLTGVGVDSNTALAPNSATGESTSTTLQVGHAYYRGIPGTGQHRVFPLEFASAATCSFTGVTAPAQGALLFQGPPM